MVVVDASVIGPALLNPRGHEAATLASAELLATPELMDVEVAAFLRRKVEIEKSLGAPLALRVLERLERLPIPRHSHRGLGKRIWALRHNLTACDATYVALAESLGASLATADRRLAAAPGVKCGITLVV